MQLLVSADCSAMLIGQVAPASEQARRHTGTGQLGYLSKGALGRGTSICNHVSKAVHIVDTLWDIPYLCARPVAAQTPCRVCDVR